MDQINVNTPIKIPARNTIKSSLDNSNSTETLFNSISISILVNNINPDPSKYIEHIQSHN